MADRDYTINLATQNAAKVAGELNSIAAALKDVDAWATKAQKSLAAVGKSASSMSQAGTQAKNLAAQLGAVGTAATQAGTAVGGLNANIGKVSVASGGATSSLATLGLGFSAMGAAKQLMGGLVQEMEAAKDRLDAMAEKAAKFRESMRETANIKGETGPNNRVMADVLGIAVATGMTPEKAEQFVNKFENTAPTAREQGAFGRPGSPEAAKVEKDILIETGKTSRRLGIDEQTAGDAVGLASMYGGLDSVESAIDRFGGAMKGLSRGKGSYTDLVKAMSKAVPKLMNPEDAAAEGANPGRIKNFAQAGIYTGVLSLDTSTPDQAAQREIQISRVLNTTDEGQAKDLASMGVREGDDDPRKLIALSEGLKAAGVKDPVKWMAERKIGTESTRLAVKAGMLRSDTLKRQLDEEEVSKVGRSEMAANETFVRTDKSASRSGADASSESLDIAQGTGYEVFENAKKWSVVRMKAILGDRYKGRTFRVGNLINTPVAMAARGVSAAEDQEENDRLFGAIPILRQQAKLAGFDLDKEFPVLGETASTYHDRATAFGQAAKRVEAAGKDPFARADFQPAVDRRVEEMRRADDAGGVNVNVNDQGLKAGADRLGEVAAKLDKVADKMAGKVGGGAPGGRMPGGNGGASVLPKRN
jgi:hypothetical protein